MVTKKMKVLTVDEVLAEESSERADARRNRGCTVGQWIAKHPEGDRLKALMADSATSSATLQRVLARLGFEVTASSIKRHRSAAKDTRGDRCSCGKAGLL